MQRLFDGFDQIGSGGLNSVRPIQHECFCKSRQADRSSGRLGATGCVDRYHWPQNKNAPIREAASIAAKRLGVGLPKVTAPKNANAAAARRVRTHLAKAS
jgi:hypothetical protein